MFMTMCLSLNRRFGGAAIVLALLVVYLSGCQYDPWADGFLKKQAAERDGVGSYNVDSDTLARHISVPDGKSALQVSRNAEIALSADHKATFSEVPDFWYDGKPRLCVISGLGSWQLGKNDIYSVVNVQIEPQDHRDATDKCGDRYYGQFDALRKQTALQITRHDRRS
jgi:hypothetical protein